MYIALLAAGEAGKLLSLLSTGLLVAAAKGSLAPLRVAPYPLLVLEPV